MQEFSIRWENFRSLKDTAWLRIRPITVIIGANASGKTSIHAPLLLLKQTLDSPDTTLPLKSIGEFFDAGSYHDLIFKHDLSKRLSFSIRTEKFIGNKDNEELKELGTYRPGEIKLQFSYNDETKQVNLQRYHVRDIYHRTLVHRYFLKDGTYSIRKPDLDSVEKSHLNAIKKSKPEHFLFDIESYIRFRLRTSEEEEVEEFTIEESEALYLKSIDYIAGWVNRLLSNISYIGPLRQRPKRLYEITGERPSGVGVKGQNTPEIIFMEKETELMEIVNEWVSKFEFGFQIECKDLSPSAFEVLLRRKKEAPKIGIADTGFGLSQVLPLIVQGFYSKENSIIIAEQPEIHLNPKLQALLADLFVSIASNEKCIFVETHSEHLLLRLRRLVAEGKISSEDISLYYVEKSKDVSKIREVPIEEDGHIKHDRWPKGFFGEALKESMGLAQAQQREGANNAK